MKILDEETREEIVNSTGTIAVSASAGSGKTSIMIKKMVKILKEIKNHKTVAALTFTVKASEEIRKRVLELGITKEFLVLTNDTFVEHEIIRPFLRDAFGKKYMKNFIVSYSNSNKFTNFEEGMALLLENNVLGTYRNNKKNFKFEIAREILKKSQAAREYIKSKYNTLFLDEYQDSDAEMHQLFMYIKKDLNIDLFIVGDEKQSIYLWRGAEPNIFSLLVEEGINTYELVTNFRSHYSIVNYANLIHNFVHFDLLQEGIVSHVVHCIAHDGVSSVVELIRSGELDINKSIAIIVNINEDAQKITQRLNDFGYKFLFIPRTPLDESSENSIILKAICSYLIDSMFTIYDFLDVVRLDAKKYIVKETEKKLSVIESYFPISVDVEINEIFKSFVDSVGELNDYLSLNLSEKEIGMLWETLINKSYYPAYTQDETYHKVMTVFGAKGLEFDQVVTFNQYYNFKDNNKKNNHYVAVTRAKEKFIMIEDGTYSEKVIEIIHNKTMLSEKNLFKTVDHT